MARVGASKKKKSPRATELSQLKKELKRVTEQLESYKREVAEALDQQVATSEILRVIADSPTDLQSVLDVVAENAARLCDANDAAISRADGDKFWLVASHGSIPIHRREEFRSMNRRGPLGRAMIDRETIHIHDLSSSEAQAEFPSARAIGQSVGVRTDIKARSGALAVTADPITVDTSKTDHRTHRKKSAPGDLRFFVDNGGRMSYGPDFAAEGREAARLVDKILKGTKPADLPVEQPAKFELLINLKAAKQIGLTIPQSLLYRADPGDQMTRDE